MQRTNGWEERLEACVRDARRARFSWAEQHCGGFAARCVDAMCGTDFAREIGAFDGPLAAARWLSLEGGLEWAVERRLTTATKVVLQYQMGDVVLLSSGRPEWPHSLGIYMRGVALATGLDRLELRLNDWIVRGWRIPWPT